jgi:hypothetical protein
MMVGEEATELEIDGVPQVELEGVTKLDVSAGSSSKLRLLFLILIGKRLDGTISVRYLVGNLPALTRRGRTSLVSVGRGVSESC